TVWHVLGNGVLLEQDREGANGVLGGNAVLVQGAMAQPFDGGHAAAGGEHFIAGLQALDLGLALWRGNTGAPEEASVNHGAIFYCDLGQRLARGIVLDERVAIGVFGDAFVANILTGGGADNLDLIAGGKTGYRWR